MKLSIIFLAALALTIGCAAKVTLPLPTDTSAVEDGGEDGGVTGAPDETFAGEGGSSLLTSNSYLVFVNSSSLGFGSSSSPSYSVGDPVTEVGIEAVLDAVGGN